MDQGSNQISGTSTAAFGNSYIDYEAKTAQLTLDNSIFPREVVDIAISSFQLRYQTTLEHKDGFSIITVKTMDEDPKKIAALFNNRINQITMQYLSKKPSDLLTSLLRVNISKLRKREEIS